MGVVERDLAAVSYTHLYLDYDDEEIRRKFTIGTSIAPIPYKDYKINLLDTSGHPDFIGDTLATMQDVYKRQRSSRPAA